MSGITFTRYTEGQNITKTNHLNVFGSKKITGSKHDSQRSTLKTCYTFVFPTVTGAGNTNILILIE